VFVSERALAAASAKAARARRRHFLLRPRQSILVKESGGSVLACEKLSPTVA